MKKLLLSLGLFVAITTHAQTPQITGFTKLDVIILDVPANGTVTQSNDGGYFFAKGLTLTKYKADNSVDWSTSLMGTNRLGYMHAITSVCDDGQGGAIITGKVQGTLTSGNDSITPQYTAPGMGFYTADAFVARVNATGKIWWNRLGEYKGDAPDEEKGISVKLKNNKVYWLASSKGRDVRFNGVDYPLSSYGNNKALLVEFGIDGTVNWVNMSKGGGVVPAFLAVNNNNEVFYSGYNLGSSSKIDFDNSITIQYNQASFLAVKFNATGKAQWVKTYDDDNLVQNQYGLTADNDGNIYACGTASNYSSSYGIKKAQGYVLKIKGNDGTHDWTRTLSKVSGASNVLHGPLIGVQFSNDKVYVAGNTNGDLYLQSSATDSVEMKTSKSNTAEHFIAAYDKNGTLSWSKKANGGAAGGTISYLQATPTSVIAIGTYSTGVVFDTHTMPASGANVGAYFIGFYNIKTGDGGSSGLSDHKQDLSALVFPNPTNGLVNIELTEAGTLYKIMLTDLFGRSVSFNGQIENNSAQIDLQNIAKGIYFLTIETTDHSYATYKLTVQ